MRRLQYQVKHFLNTSMSVYFLFLFTFMFIVCQSANSLKQGSGVTEMASPLKQSQVPVKLAERPIDNKLPLTIGREVRGFISSRFLMLNLFNSSSNISCGVLNPCIRRGKQIHFIFYRLDVISTVVIYGLSFWYPSTNHSIVVFLCSSLL